MHLHGANVVVAASVWRSGIGALDMASSQRKTRGELRGGKTYHKAPSQKRFGPPTCDTIPPPPFVHAMSFSLEEQTRQIPLSEAS